MLRIEFTDNYNTFLKIKCLISYTRCAALLFIYRVNELAKVIDYLFCSLPTEDDHKTIEVNDGSPQSIRV